MLRADRRASKSWRETLAASGVKELTEAQRSRSLEMVSELAQEIHAAADVVGYAMPTTLAERVAPLRDRFIAEDRAIAEAALMVLLAILQHNVEEQPPIDGLLARS